jgi:hypothetical protein
VPAAAVIPAPIAYIKVVAVKKLVVELQTYFVTAVTATLLSRDSELLDTQVESYREEQESVEATPRGICRKVNTLDGP